MSLNFDFSQMIERVGREEYDRITDHPLKGKPEYKGEFDEKWHPITDGLIWLTMSIGMGSITPDNVDEFIERALAWQAMQGGCLMNDNGRFYITAEDIRNHIGMWTNVSTITKAKFKGNLYAAAVDEGKRQCRVQVKSAFDICKERAEA